MFIANTTKQHYQPNLRVPELTRLMIVKIPSGHQVEIGKTWNSQQADAVIRQLESFGARNVKELSGRKLKDFAGLLYSDKPISVHNIEAAHETVVEDQERRSVQEFKKNALRSEERRVGKEGR